MGCTSEGYRDQTKRERYVRDTARSIIYVLKSLKKQVPSEIIDIAYDDRAKDKQDKLTPMLCSILSEMNDKDKKRIMDNNSYESELLANWWKNHQELDEKKIKKEKEQKRKEKVLNKLSKADRRILGF